VGRAWWNHAARWVWWIGGLEREGFSRASARVESSPLRVIAGSLKGRRLKAPTWEGLRPTSDKLRETLFNILAPRIRGARVLDGYAGTGAIGIEAISRGAAMVTFVERDRRAQALIAENLAHCGVESGYAIIRETVARAIDDCGVTKAFEIVLLDPPYDQQPDAVMAAAGELLTPHGVLVLEHARRQVAPEAAGSLVRVREVASGSSALAFYELNM
jgi:16S rRNA (guanine966-N2)-methyltransferase